jgi:hypothetical protein
MPSFLVSLHFAVNIDKNTGESDCNISVILNPETNQTRQYAAFYSYDTHINIISI